MANIPFAKLITEYMAQQSMSSSTKAIEDQNVAENNDHHINPINKLPAEINCEIAKHVHRASDLRSFRLASRPFAAAGKHEIEQRLKTKKIVSPSSHNNDYEPRPYCKKVHELNVFFPFQTLKHLKFVNISPRQMEMGDETLSKVFFPQLETLWLQNLELQSSDSVNEVLEKHAGTLKDVKIIMCEIIRPQAGEPEDAEVLYQRYTWNTVLQKLDYKPFSINTVELQTIHICTGRREVCNCHSIPADGDRSKLERVRTAKAVHGDKKSIFKFSDSLGSYVYWEGEDSVSEMVEDIRQRDYWFLKHNSWLQE